MKPKYILKRKMVNMFFDLQRKMMELERMEQRNSESDDLPYPYLIRHMQALQSAIESYLLRHFKWDRLEELKGFYTTKWYLNFTNDKFNVLQSERRFIAGS